MFQEQQQQIKFNMPKKQEKVKKQQAIPSGFNPSNYALFHQVKSKQIEKFYNTYGQFF